MESSNKLRKILSLNIKKQRKILGLTQEKLAEVAELSSQTINDIEGCRMWVSDKSLTKLADSLQVEAYQLLLPMSFRESLTPDTDMLLLDLENKLVSTIHHYFKEAKNV